MKALISECPHCGNSEGYFTKNYAYGQSRSQFLWNGEHGNDEEMHDYLRYKLGKYAYCNQCGKRIFRMVEE